MSKGFECARYVVAACRSDRSRKDEEPMIGIPRKGRGSSGTRSLSGFEERLQSRTVGLITYSI